MIEIGFCTMASLAFLLALFSGAAWVVESRVGKQPISDADLRATGDTGYPCVASGPMIEVCNWYSKFIATNPKPPKSLKKPFIYGGEATWHGPDEEVTKACEANFHTICVQKNPLCDEYFDMCD